MTMLIFKWIEAHKITRPSMSADVTRTRGGPCGNVLGENHNDVAAQSCDPLQDVRPSVCGSVRIYLGLVVWPSSIARSVTRVGTHFADAGEHPFVGGKKLMIFRKVSPALHFRLPVTRSEIRDEDRIETSYAQKLTKSRRRHR